MARRGTLAERFIGSSSCATVVVAAAIVLAGPPSAPACDGDCNRDGTVTIDEILRGVNIALGSLSSSECAGMDRDGNGGVTVDELLLAVNEALTACPAEPIFPADYRATFTEVRDCRFSIEHDGVYVRVLANPVAAAPYQTEESPLPAGSIVVKEEFSGSDCADATLQGWRVMRKEAAGFDPADGDWHWQWVERDRSVRFDDKSTCIGCHSRPACLARDRMCTVGGPQRGRLQTVLTNLPGALLSIAGTSATDVYAVGADPTIDDFGPSVLHYDGVRWRRLNSGATGDLWWVSVTPIDGAFYFAGENGLVLRYDPAARRFTRLTTPGTELLYGVWGTSAKNLFVVGGDPDDEDAGGVIWHFDGSEWAVVDLSTVLPEGMPTLFKVWGRSAEEVYAVGRRGTALRFDGTSWSKLATGSIRPLFTVHGSDTLVVATGGFSDGIILELEGESFVNRAMPGTPQMNGVFIPPDSRGVAAGIAGSLALRADSGWELPDTGLITTRDFHATWVDPDGGIWAVGGDLSDLTRGILAYSGAAAISGELVELAACPPPTPGSSTTASVSYTGDIVPLFVAKGCLSPPCHGGVFPSSSYDLRSYESTFGPGVLAKSRRLCEIVPGDPDASFLVEKLGAGPRLGARMPPAPQPSLAEEEIALIRTWILEGAISDAPPATPTPTRPAAATQTPQPTGGSAACDEPGVICTVAGTGRSLFDGDRKPALQTSLYYPLGVTFDALRRPLIIDWNNLRIRRINDDGIVETIMGTGSEDLPTDGALAVDTPLHHASDVAFDPIGQLYVAGDHAPIVFRVGTDNRVLTVAGTTDSGYDGDGGPARQAKLTSPFGVLPTEDGGFYISDLDAHVIRYVTPDGIISTVAGTGVAGYSGDHGPGTAAQLAGPAKMRLDGEGNLYFCEAKNHVVRRLTRDGTLSTVAGTGARGYAGDGGPADLARFDSPYDLRFAANGDLYVADTGNSVIRRIDRTGVVTTVVGRGRAGFAGDGGPANGCEMNRPSGLTFAADGSLWIADTFNNRVRRVATPINSVEAK